MNKPHDFPPGLDTPFNDMTAFLIRATMRDAIDEYDIGFIDHLKHYHSFTELSREDRLTFFGLLDEYNYFDMPCGPIFDYEAIKKLTREVGGDQ